jgi:hypothetical protein
MLLYAAGMLGARVAAGQGSDMLLAEGGWVWLWLVAAEPMLLLRLLLLLVVPAVLLFESRGPDTLLLVAELVAVAWRRKCANMGTSRCRQTHCTVSSACNTVAAAPC